MTTRARVAALVALVLVLVAGTAIVVVRARERQQEQLATAPLQNTVSVGELDSKPRIVFRNSAIGSNYGRVAMVSMADPGGARAITDLSCDRVFAAGGRTLCLASQPGLVTTYSAAVYSGDGGEGSTKQGIPLTGTPSRARLSADGLLSSTTSFVAGDSYASISFSTRTVVTALTKGTSLDLENFTLIDGGTKITPADRNYWGTTFAADDDHFYVTVKFGGVTHLAKGQLSTQTIETVRSDAECPSLSPDGTRVAYKKLGNRRPGDWRLAVLDIATGKEVAIAETQKVDDQVEWLDNSRILYGLSGTGTNAGESNVWVSNADGSGAASILIPKAWSPAVVR